MEHVVGGQAVQARVQPCIADGRSGEAAVGRRQPLVQRLAKAASRAELCQIFLVQSVTQQHAQRRVVAQQDRLRKQQLPHLLVQRANRVHGVIHQIVHRGAAGKPTPLGEPILLPIGRHMKGKLQSRHRRHHAEVVLAALHDRQRRRHALHAFLRLAGHHILRPLDDFHVHVRLLEPQPFAGLHADGLQALLLLFGKVEDPFPTFDGWRKLLAALRLLPAGLAPRLQTLEQFPIARFVRLVLGGDNLLLFRAGRRAGLVAEVQVLLIGRLAAALASPSPEHVHQPVVGGFQFRHPLAKRVPLLGDDPRGVDQSLVIAAKSPELFQNAVQGCTQRHQFAAERFVALLALTQLFQQRVIHDAFIIAASRKTSRAKGSRTDAIFASVPELMRQRLGKSQMPYPAVAW